MLPSTLFHLTILSLSNFIRHVEAGASQGYNLKPARAPRYLGRRQNAPIPSPSPTSSIANTVQDSSDYISELEHRLSSVESKLAQCSASLAPFLPSSSCTTFRGTVTTTSIIDITIYETLTDYTTQHPTESSFRYTPPPSFANTSYAPTAPALPSYKPPPLSSSIPNFPTPVQSSNYSSATASPTTSVSPVSNYTFNPLASSNVAVYYGASPATQAGGLLFICQDPTIDIVNLAFVSTFFGENGYPDAEFGPACGSSTSPTAPGLANCAGLVPQIKACQLLGKKVFVSLGGYTASTAFYSDNQAEQFASTIWDLFGGSSNISAKPLRPFGDAVVDGFDMDNEDHSTQYWDTFASALRSKFSDDASKRYYISAAPQCPRPDASIPLSLMKLADFVWVQFYNNPSCNIGTPGFISSLQAWSSDLGSSGSITPRLYVGGWAWNGGGTGYLPPNELGGVLSQVRRLGLSNLGGVMLWDGTEALNNTDGGEILQVVKQALKN